MASLENSPLEILLTAWSSSEAGFEDNSVPECFEAFNQAMGGPNGVAFVEVVRAEILVGGAPLQHIVAGGKDGTGHSDQRPLGTAQRRQAAELRLQVRPFAFGGGPSSFAQGSAQPGIPTARSAACCTKPGLASTLREQLWPTRTLTTSARTAVLR